MCIFNVAYVYTDLFIYLIYVLCRYWSWINGIEIFQARRCYNVTS